MTKNPIYSGLAASAYIVALCLTAFYVLPKQGGAEDTVFAPILFLSVFVFSAAIMAYLFASEPIKMYLDGNKSGAVHHFLKTLLAFGVVSIALGLLSLI